MKKLAVIIVLTVALGVAGAIMVDQASAFGFFGGKAYGGGYGYSAPYYYGITPYWGYGYGYYPGYWGCKGWKKGKMKGAKK